MDTLERLDNHIKTLQDIHARCRAMFDVMNAEEILKDIKAMMEAKEAVEFRQKEKPLDVTFDDEYIEFWNCPNCGIQHSGIIDGKEALHSYCPNCGKAIDWSQIDKEN